MSGDTLFPIVVAGANFSDVILTDRNVVQSCCGPPLDSYLQYYLRSPKFENKSSREWCYI